MTVMVPRNRMLVAAGKKIRVLSSKALESNLEHFCGSYADAYRCRVEEAQAAIFSRLVNLPTRITNTSTGERDGT